VEEAQMFSYSLIEKAEGVRKSDLSYPLDALLVTNVVRGGDSSPFRAKCPLR